MPEIKPDLSDQTRCISVHWSLPVQCVLPRTHRENWHEAWHPQTGNRIRYRRSFGIFRTGELRDGAWYDLEVPPPETAAEAEVKRLKADRDRWHDTYQQHANAVDEFFGDLLALLPGATDTGMDAYDQIPRGIEALRAEVKRLQAEVEDLRENDRKLTALESAGVDNWDGYGYAMELLHG